MLFVLLDETLCQLLGHGLRVIPFCCSFRPQSAVQDSKPGGVACREQGEGFAWSCKQGSRSVRNAQAPFVLKRFPSQSPEDLTAFQVTICHHFAEDQHRKE